MNDAESNAPQSQDNTTDHGNKSNNSGALGNGSLSKTERPPTPPKHSHTYYGQKPPWWERLNWQIIQLIVELLVFAVGVRVAWIYSDQLDAMIKSNCINKQSADAATSAARTASDALAESKRSIHLDQRAWLQIDPQPPQDDLERFGSSWRTGKIISIGIRNTGKTPALHIHGHVRFQDIKNTFPNPSYKDNLDFSYKDTPRVPVTGQAIVSIPTLHPNGSFSQIVRGGTHTNEAHVEMFIHGELRYCDIFKEEHLMRFCLKWVPSSDPKMAQYVACDNVFTMGGIDIRTRNAIDDAESPKQCKER
jgi:hypothetical protein